MLGVTQFCKWAAACLLAIPLWGQLYTGSISGTVKDPSGAVIPNATVTATDVERKIPLTATTDGQGRYVISSVPPSRYSVEISAPGFDRYVREDFAVDVNVAVTVNASLQVATGATVVAVDSTAPLLQTENATLGQTINRKFINDLPLIGRGVFDLVFLAPGTTQAAGRAYGPGNNTGGTNFVSNGSRNNQSDILLDGLSTTTMENNGGITQALYTPNVDAVQEFRLDQGNFSAEFGFSSSTVVNAITRSGTNQFHGVGYDYIRNKVTDANDYFSNAAGQPLPPVHKNNFGGVFGGPVWIPKIYNGHNRTFFFFDYDGTRQKTAQTGSGGVPSAAESTGDFGELCGYAGGTFNAAGQCSAAAGQIWDPFTGVFTGSQWTRTSFIPFDNLKTYISPGNPLSPQGNLPATPGNLIDPVALKLAAYFPKPNLGVGSAAYNPYLNWHGTGVAAANNNTYDLKLDHHLNDRILLNAKYSRQWGDTDNGANLFGNAGDTHTQGKGHGVTDSGVVNFTGILSPRTVVTATAGITHLWASNKNLLNCCYPSLDPVTTLGMPAYIADSGYKAFPQTYLAQGYESVGNQGWSNFTTAYETRHLLGSISTIAGNHQLKAGGEWRLHYLNMLFNGEPAGVYNFSQFGSAQNQNWSGGSGGGDALATFLMGLNDGWGGYEIPVRPATSSKQTGLYIQDNWKVSDKLTVNAGLRYDIESPRTERYDRMSYFDPNAPSPLGNVPGLGPLKGAVEFVGVNGNSNSIFDTYWKEVQPRFGFAYRLGSDMVLRGGYGIYYDQSLSGVAGLGQNSFNGFSATTNNQNWSTTNPGVPVSFLRNPYPFGINQPVGAAGGPGYLLGQNLSSIDPYFNRTPQEQTWSFGIQKQAPWQIVLDASYIGKKGTHLYLGGIPALDYLNSGAAAQYRADPAAANAQVPNPLAGRIPGESSTIPQYELWLPFPQYGVSNNAPGLSVQPAPEGNSIYHSLQLKAEKRFSSGVQFLATYVFSKSIDDSSVVSSNTTFLGGSTSYQDPNNRHLERSLSQFNVPQVFQFSWVYELPFGRGKTFGANISKTANLLLGGWQLNGIYRWDDGQPLALTLVSSQAIPTYGAQRPDLTGTLKQNSGINLNQFFANPGVITTPAPYVDGTESRTDPHLRSPGTNTISASLFKDFPLHFTEAARLQLRLEFFNLLNHPQFSAPDTAFGDPNFGRITSQANSPREGQLALKLYF